jgi:glutathione S-transferase
MIELYQAEWCLSSARVRQRLTELAIPFVARQVEPEPHQRRAMQAAVGSQVIPVLVLADGTVFDGDADEIVDELDRYFPEDQHTAQHHVQRNEAAAFED